MSISRRSVAVLLPLLLTVSSVAATPTQLPSPVAAKIDRDIRKALHRFAVPGAAVMVIQDGNLAFIRAYGLRDTGRELPVRVDTHFEIGSITKQFTAASILQLEEAGKLQIDRPLPDYLSD